MYGFKCKCTRKGLGARVKVLTWYDKEWGYRIQMPHEAMKLLG